MIYNSQITEREDHFLLKGKYILFSLKILKIIRYILLIAWSLISNSMWFIKARYGAFNLCSLMIN